ncbi:MAG: glutamine synthetase family protein [Burkholderiaceae bacterium]
MSFVQSHQLWTDEAQDAAKRLSARLRNGELKRLRFGWADQHGLVRGKALFAQRAEAALENGVGFVGTNLLKDSSDRTTQAVFTRGAGFGSEDFEGAADVLLVADPLSFVELPWSPGSGWVQCQPYFYRGERRGQLVPFDTRGVLQRCLESAHRQSYQMRVGLEVECHLFRLAGQAIDVTDLGWPGAAPAVNPLSMGYRLLSEQRYDKLEPVVDLLTEPLIAMGLPLESVEVELGPSQLEFVFGPQDALAGADTMLQFRHAAKQIMQRHGYHISFMCRPALPHAMSSGWHLHQSLISLDSGRNVFCDPKPLASGLAASGHHYLGGLVRHAAAGTVFATPTINGYRRYRPNALAPERINWGRDNRGAMLRVVGGGEDPATRIENRVGEPAANPYLYLASQLAAGLEGIAQQADPGASADEPYASEYPLLPRTLDQALAALADDPFYSKAFGQEFIDYYSQLKQFELARFHLEVTEWEQREYFDLF